MPIFPRFLRPIPASRRAYSFFSSKSGGGRYFNSAKPPKVVAPTSPNSKSNGRVDAAPGDTSSSSGSPKSPEDAPPSQPSSPITQGKDAPAPTMASPFLAPPNHVAPLPNYFPLSPHDLKLHQFFSLHRPLFLNQPSSSLFESSSPLTFGSRPAAEETAPAELGTIDNPPEASPEADADAARQLVRALVMNRVGGTISWEDTLRRLGIDEAESKEREKKSLESLEIYMDSTKRKRRKKMKKHKLKKRRKASRAQRLKIGR